MKEWHIHTSQLRRLAPDLHAGDRVFLSGTVYTARDAAHKRMFEQQTSGIPFPFPVKDAVIYYAGATPAPAGLPIGACGPTTSGRMDPYAPALYDSGLVATIGKGQRSKAVVESIRRNGGFYFCAVGGAGALAARHVTACRVLAYPDLGCEAVKQLEVEEFPLIVAVDAAGGDLFEGCA